MGNIDQDRIKEKFDALVERAEENPELKSEILNTIEVMNNIGSFLDLFTTKYIAVQTDYIDLISRNTTNTTNTTNTNS